MKEKVSSWVHILGQQIKRHSTITGGMLLIFMVFVACTLSKQKHGWDWTGFFAVQSKQTTVSTSEGAFIVTEVQSSKTLWDWLQLLGVLAVPVAVAWYTAKQEKLRDKEKETKDEEKKHNEAVRDAEIKDSQQEAALQGYFDKISELLIHEHLDARTADGKLKPVYRQVRNVARVRTVTVLKQLDVRRVGSVFTFLREAGLLLPKLDDNVVSLKNADLHGVIPFPVVY